MEKILQKLIIKCLVDYCESNEIIILGEINLSTKLIGRDSILDSIGLVTFLAELEDLIEEELDKEIQIADESAMSRFRSPFTSVESLKEFLLEKIV